MLKVGLTGGIAAGKSTVGRMFGELGCRVIDSDLITRKLFAAGDPVNLAVAAAFGRSVVAFDGSIDRRVLGDVSQPLERSDGSSFGFFIDGHIK